MHKTNSAELLFEYLRDIIYMPQKAGLDLAKLDEEHHELAQGLAFLAQCLAECRDFETEIVKGNLNAKPPPPSNPLAGPVKSLHAALRHMTWQANQVALGDYGQRMDYLGEFADAFNTMTLQLAERQRQLEQKIEQGKKITQELQLHNQLLNHITQHAHHQTLVYDTESQEILMTNALADAEIFADKNYLERILALLPEKQMLDGLCL